MAEAVWNGFLRLSLVSCPVRLAPATSDAHVIQLDQLNVYGPAVPEGTTVAVPSQLPKQFALVNVRFGSMGGGWLIAKVTVVSQPLRSVTVTL